MRRTGDKRAGTKLILFQDMTLSVLASLLSILMVRWISDPIPGFTAVVLVYIGSALLFTLTGVLISGS